VFEVTIAEQLKKHKAKYEALIVPYTLDNHYWPDFILPSGLLIEVKGRFTSADRRKHVAIRAQHPELDIRFVFYRASEKIAKNSKTTYGMWCDKHGFLWAEGSVPKEWVNANRRPRLSKAS
jgi:hypothetical protein